MPTLTFTASERHIFRRRPRIHLSDWAAQHLIVKDGPYAGGRYRKDVNPYLVGIMDAWSTPTVVEVVACGSAQTGKTVVLHAALAYSVDMRPGPRMLAMQDDDALGKVVATKLLPMFRASPPVRAQLGKVRSSRIAFRDGTALFLASAQSPGQRASISIQDLMVDEEALYKQLTGQGVPVLELLERTRSYQDTRKILRVSKPIGGHECSIVQALDECDEVRRYAVRCPACLEHIIMDESGLVAVDENGLVTAKKATAQEVERLRLGRYKCRCGVLWTDYMRDRAVAQGEWVADEAVESPRKVGFVLPAILSRMVSISEVLAAKMRANASDSPAHKQQYTNGYWAMPYRAVEMVTTEANILARVDKSIPERTVPGDAVALTAGVDVQKRGFWYTVWAWRTDLSSVLIDYGRLADWDSIHALLHETRYDYENDSPKAGQSLAIWRAGMDSGGTRSHEDVVSRTEEVYRYVRKHGAGRVFACKGASHESHTPVRPTMMDRMPSSRARIPGGLWLYLLDTHYFKSLLFARLEPDARQPITLHRKTGEDFAAQMSAEELIRDRNGKLVWHRKRKNNHLLDCAMLAHACVDGSWMPSFLQIVERERMEQEELRTGARPQPEESPAPSQAQGEGRHTPQRALPGNERQLPGRMPEPMTRQRPSFMRRNGQY